jgi:hypothetical protein
MSTLARQLTAAANTAGKQDASDAANALGIGGLKATSYPYQSADATPVTESPTRTTPPACNAY